MTFQEAMGAMRQGTLVRRPGWVEGAAITIEDNAYVYEHGEDSGFDPADAEATDWEVLRPVLRNLEEIEAYMVFNTEKNRWVSTTNPEKHINAGHRVAIFSLLSDVG